MKSIAAAAALAAVVPAVMAQPQPLMINSLAGIVQCEPIKLSWSGGTAPYYISLLPAEQVTAPPLKIFPVQQGNSYTWTVDLPVNTAFTTMIKDASGQPNYSGDQIVQAGPDASCLNANVTVTAGSSGGPATPAPSGSSPAPGAAAVTGSSSSVPASSTHPTSSAGPSSTSPAPSPTHTNGAGHESSLTAFLIAGVMGAVGAVFM